MEVTLKEIKEFCENTECGECLSIIKYGHCLFFGACPAYWDLEMIKEVLNGAKDN